MLIYSANKGEQDLLINTSLFIMFNSYVTRITFKILYKAYFQAMEILSDFFQATSDYSNWLWKSILLKETNFIWGNYFYYLTLVSIAFFIAEAIIPWRSNQKIIRKGFWKDLFFMYFNFFLFYLIFLAGASEVGVHVFENVYSFFGWNNNPIILVNNLPVWVQMGILFILSDFVHWSIHLALHRFSFLWKYHKVHHSVKEMGFAAHLRYHWIESIIYKSITFIVLSFFGFNIADLFIIHAIKIAWGHFNHANINVNIGFLKYLFNNPKMHLWHHAKKLPNHLKYGVNFGITLSIWDYIFGTVYQPNQKPDLTIGYIGEENDKQDLLHQISPIQNIPKINKRSNKG